VNPKDKRGYRLPQWRSQDAAPVCSTESRSFRHGFQRDCIRWQDRGRNRGPEPPYPHHFPRPRAGVGDEFVGRVRRGIGTVQGVGLSTTLAGRVWIQVGHCGEPKGSGWSAGSSDRSPRRRVATGERLVGRLVHHVERFVPISGSVGHLLGIGVHNPPRIYDESPGQRGRASWAYLPEQPSCPSADLSSDEWLLQWWAASHPNANGLRTAGASQGFMASRECTQTTSGYEFGDFSLIS
jgi:hypothetical protein